MASWSNSDICSFCQLPFTWPSTWGFCASRRKIENATRFSHPGGIIVPIQLFDWLLLSYLIGYSFFETVLVYPCGVPQKTSTKRPSLPENGCIFLARKIVVVFWCPFRFGYPWVQKIVIFSWDDTFENTGTALYSREYTAPASSCSGTLAVQAWPLCIQFNFKCKTKWQVDSILV